MYYQNDQEGWYENNHRHHFEGAKMISKKLRAL